MNDINMSEEVFFRNLRKIVNYVLGSVLVMLIASVSHTVIKFNVLENNFVHQEKKVNELFKKTEKLERCKADINEIKRLERTKANKESVNIMFDRLQEDINRNFTIEK